MDALHHAFAGRVGNVIGAHLLEQRHGIGGHGERTAGEPGGVPIGTPAFTENGKERADAGADKEAGVALDGAQRGGLGGFIRLRGVPQRFESRHGGRHATRTSGLADERNQIGADVGLGIMHQPDGCPWVCAPSAASSRSWMMGS